MLHGLKHLQTVLRDYRPMKIHDLTMLGGSHSVADSRFIGVAPIILRITTPFNLVLENVNQQMMLRVQPVKKPKSVRRQLSQMDLSQFRIQHNMLPTKLSAPEIRTYCPIVEL